MTTDFMHTSFVQVIAIDEAINASLERLVSHARETFTKGFWEKRWTSTVFSRSLNQARIVSIIT